MDKKSWLEKLESMEEEQQEVIVPEREQNTLRDFLEGRGKFVLLGVVGLLILVIVLIVVSSGGENRSENEFQNILARLEVIETKIVGLENQESGRQQALVRMQGDFSILTMRVDKLSREMKEQFTETASRPAPKQTVPQPTRPVQQPPAATPTPQAAATAPVPTAQPRPQPAATTTQPAASRPIQHEVQPGETLFRISRTYGVSVDDLRRLNDITGDRINPGQILKVRP